ncbi:hypothetical protein F0344_18190 [Streptomyces finlayi]|uniref:Uncharacterized protein n=1 Tax=Streptomyces finlayi TaxID=67296 RepID=A0A7G7BLT1_9ACTN|nr:hypothetical protein [Streptomyces finlayi]QNE76296.1 hypothetical protein F0344_18190 [Streptomyces finlayi]
MAPGLLPSRWSRASRRVLCLAVSAAAVLGPVSWTYAAERVPGAPGGAAHRSAGTPPSDAGARGPLALAPRSADLPGTSRSADLPAAATGSPSPAPTATAPPLPSAPGPTPSAPASRPSAGPSASAASTSPPAVPSGSPSALPPAASRPAGPPSGSAAPPPGGSSASPSASAVRSPLAGRPAGEGRTRPGRSLSPLELARADALLEEEEPEPDIGEVLPAEVTPSTSAGAPQSAPQALDGPAVRQVQEVSLGAGIALVGLGLGFLAFRMRRAR